MKLAYLFFIAIFFPFFVNASVVINEVAWMGAVNFSGDEWIELKNTGDESVDVSSWILEAEDGTPMILFSEKCSNEILPAQSFLLLERTDDTSVPNILADCVYAGALEDGGETLVLKNGGGGIVDTIDASAGWPAGDNTTKETMQKSGSGWITAPGTPKAANAASIPESSGGNETEENAPAESNEEELPQDSKSGFIEKKQFRADAGGDTAAIVGVEKLFEGKGYDLDGKLLMSGDFLWNFGDGASARGKNVRHTFLYPGKYRIVFDVSSGVYNASDTVLVTVIPPPLSITEVKPGVDGFIELWNNSDYELDISYWGAGNENFAYYFPNGTRILPQARVAVPYAISGIEFSDGGKAALYYPNGVESDSFIYSGAVQNDESFHVISGSVKLGVASPGSDRFVARVSPSFSSFAGNGVANDEIDTQDKSVVQDAESELAVSDENNQTASVISADSHVYEQSWFWFAVIIFFGFISAGGVFMLRRMN